MGSRERSRGLFDRRPICGACLGACEVQAITSTHLCCHDSRNFCTAVVQRPLCSTAAENLGESSLRILPGKELEELFSSPLLSLQAGGATELEETFEYRTNIRIAPQYRHPLFQPLSHATPQTFLVRPHHTHDRFVSFRFVSFRFVLFDAGRPLLRGTSFWGFRTTAVTLQFNGGRAFVRP